MSILENINGHDDLVKLNDTQRIALCDEIRSFLVESVSATGGHLASNLGVVELSVALETVFDTKIDRLVFDVGHQSYVHKLLTGRQADFQHLRQFGGIAGFPKPSESNADAFVAGHASSSVSIALGMARARTLKNDDYKVVAVLGDGAATGGMAYEGLNDAADSREPMIVILNDNEMSIDRNVGGVSKHLSRIRSKANYVGLKRRYRKAMARIPGGKIFSRVIHGVKKWVKRILLPGTIFENMGFTYYGPVDGHNVSELISLLSVCKDMSSPVLIHVVTQKGKGYTPAQEKPSKFHGIGRFDPVTGESLGSAVPTFSQTFGLTMVFLAEEMPELCAITAAMPGGTGLLEFKNQFPKRLFDVGIAEEHAVSMAGGLAKQGMVPVVAIYSTFLQRAYDQILQDIAMLGLHVVFAVDRAGLVGEDGETHHGVFDVGFLRHVPGLKILAPASRKELDQMLRWAVKLYHGPVAIRYPRGGDGAFADSFWEPSQTMTCHRRGTSCAILTYGTTINAVEEAAQILQQDGIDATVLRLTELKDWDEELLRNSLQGIENVLVVEETHAHAGIYETIAAQLGRDHDVYPVHLPDRYVPHGSLKELYRHYGLDGDSIARKMKEVLEG